ncbi:chromatin-remodeling ATPase INO80 isoform X2 [Contarinia nasturtii]|uniref:chromatin-remodeling ATPase INO80 isoform X2 n=1 Tax=Contarinia nasturtii TaxID=265458 RepID=UPI0012D39FB4|nr:chromatin-remodeling ATPase INO80 isoform X2 [Contarinia nasturtii]
MATVSHQPNSQYYQPHNPQQNDVLGPRKTVIILATVVCCIAVLWTQMFYPMMFGNSNVPIKNNYKDIKAGCCGVVLDHEKYANVTQPAGQSGYRQKNWKLNLMTDEISLRQERPPHLRGDHIHPAMIERGRAIPNTQTVPIVNGRPLRATDNIQYIDGRPGPVPGLRPPMGAGSVHQANQKGNSMGLLMPMYTFGIVAFAVYTIMKLVMRKSENLNPYPAPKNDETFRNEVFRRDNNKIPNLDWKQHDTSSHENGVLNNLLSHLSGNNQQSEPSRTYYDEASTTAKLEYQLRETEQLLEISLLKRKLRETERAMEQIIADIHGKAAKCDSDENITTSKNDATMDVTTTQDATDETKDKHVDSEKSNGQLTNSENNTNGNNSTETTAKRCRDSSAERKLKSSSESEPEPEPQSIYLEGALPHESQILVSDSKTTPEGVYNEDVNGNSDEPAVILSSKMTLSLINLDPVNNENGGNASNGASDHEIEDIEYEEEEDDDEIEEEEEEEDDESSDDEREIENIHGVTK